MASRNGRNGTDAVTGQAAERSQNRLRAALIALLSLLALAGVAIAWSEPANDDLRQVADSNEFLEVLPEQWLCAVEPFDDSSEIGVWAECQLGDASVTVVYTDEPPERPLGEVDHPVVRCSFYGEHVQAMWNSPRDLDDPAEDAEQVLDAFDGWESVEFRPGGCTTDSTLAQPTVEESESEFLLTAPFGRELRQEAKTTTDRLLPNGLGAIDEAYRDATDLMSSVPGVDDSSVWTMDVEKKDRLTPTSRVCAAYRGDELGRQQVDAIAADLAEIYRTSADDVRVTPLELIGDDMNSAWACPPL